VLGALRFFPALAALLICHVDFGPPRCEENRAAVATLHRLLAQISGQCVADEIGASEGVADSAIEVDGRLRMLRELFAVGGDGPLHQKLSEQRRVGPGHGAAASGDLLLDNRACIFRHADVTAARQFGEHGSLAAPRASGDDVEGWNVFHL
jgi:hypothetical protein